MSDDLYSTVLRWRNGSGLAKLRNKPVPLDDKPDLGFEFVELHYRPEIAFARVKVGVVTREALPHEIERMDCYLRAVVGP